MKITTIHASEILDSRGSPTIATVVTLENGVQGWAAVPSGASTGKYEALELRDNDPKRFHGRGVLKAIENIHKNIAPKIIGEDAENQEKIDETMMQLDDTDNKSRLGANAILSVSLSVARAQAAFENKPLYAYLSKFNPHASEVYTMPLPQMNIMNGGKHANWATDIQEYMILPISATSMCDAVRMGTEVYFSLQDVLKAEGYATTVGDEGGDAPVVSSNEAPLHFIQEAIEKAGYISGKDMGIGLDMAASELCHDGYCWLKKEEKSYTDEELMRFYNDLRLKYPIISMEDIFDEDSWESFQKYTSTVGQTGQIVGDDLYTTNVTRIQKGIDMKATNAVLIKLNQIGTLTETIRAILLAQKNNMQPIISHRSGETEDTFIADFAVAMGTGQIKTGAPARAERTAKYNRLMTIERELGEKAAFAHFPFQR